MLFDSVSSNHRLCELLGCSRCLLRNVYPSLCWSLEETTTARMLVSHRHPILTGILNLTTLSSKGHTLKYHFLTWVSCGKRYLSKYKVVSKLAIKKPLHCYEILSFELDLTLVKHMSYIYFFFYTEIKATMYLQSGSRHSCSVFAWNLFDMICSMLSRKSAEWRGQDIVAPVGK